MGKQTKEHTYMQLLTRMKTPFVAKVALQHKPINDAATTGH